MTLELPASIDSALCDMNTVRLLRRVNADQVARLCEDGQLLFVFDVSAREDSRKGRPAICERRFWFVEVVTPQFAARLTIKEVIDRILPPTRKYFRGFEISQLLLVSRVTLCRIAREMGAVIRNRTFEVSRENFAAWLSARWIGGRA